MQIVTHQCDIGILRVTGIKAEAKWDLTFCGLFCDNQCAMACKGKVDTWPLVVTKIFVNGFFDFVRFFVRKLVVVGSEIM